MKGSDWLGDQDKIEILCQDAPRVIKEMQEWNVAFSKTTEGKVAQRPFGGQRFNRTCFVADKTGHALLHGVIAKAADKGVTVIDVPVDYSENMKLTAKLGKNICPV